jgi:hypothetical protein
LTIARSNQRFLAPNIGVWLAVPDARMTTVRNVTRSLAAAAVLATGCDRVLPGPCDDGSCASQASWRQSFEQTSNRQRDVLFVVDDTPEIAPYAQTVATGLADMGALLPGDPDRNPASVHVGVVRAGHCDASTRGAACGVANGEQFLRSELCEMVSNFPGRLADGLPCMADFGTTNCARPQPLAAAMDALATPPRPGWEGFLRPDAALMVVVIAGTDDASPQPAQDVATFIKGLKPADTSLAMTSVIVPASCAAGPPQRLTEFANQFGAGGLVFDLCTGPIAPALAKINDSINTSLLPPCVRRVRDTDPATPGVQPSCVLEDHLLTADNSVTTTTLPSCDVASPPCWRLDPGSFTCDGYSLSILRPTGWCAATGTNITIECLSCADASDPACAPVR